jgi:hypothetical protein
MRICKTCQIKEAAPSRPDCASCRSKKQRSKKRLAEFGVVSSFFTKDRQGRDRKFIEQKEPPDDSKIRETAQAEARRLAAKARAESDYTALTVDDFAVGIGNDGKKDERASAEKRQEYSRSMGEFADGMHRLADSGEELPAALGSYVSNLAEQERRFNNRRLARSVSIAEAHEVLSRRRFEQAAKQYLADKIAPVGYAVRKPDTKQKRSAVLLLSDLHLGAELSALDNPIPFRAIQEARRLEFVVRQLLDFKPQYRDVTEAVLLINGDIIDGALMHDLRDGAPLTEQKVIFWRYFRQIIGIVAQCFPSVRVVCQPGNHGRDLVRHPGRATSRKWDGHEWEMYYGLREMCSSLANVSWVIDFRAVSLVDLNGSILGLSHGDTEIKIGHPDKCAEKNGSILANINATRLYGSHVDAWAFGHFHSPRYHPRDPKVIYNGALVPPNGYARTSGYIGETCGQWLWESVEGHVIGDLRFAAVDQRTDADERLGSIITPFRFES